MNRIQIALDAMGGDHGPSVVVPAAIQALKKHSTLFLTLVGQEKAIAPYLKNVSEAIRSRLTIHPASEVVEMGELPTSALRYKKNSSMRVAINLVKDGVVQACVSAGNTGALMATAHFVLKSLPGIDRPAIIATLPTQDKSKRVRVLDLGANVDSSADILSQFALMGSVLVEAVEGIERPSVALLNIGEEAIKGNEQVKKTDRLLSEIKEINYIGYVEGDKIFTGHADVIVCDGFVGNVALKTIEGASKFMGSLIKKAFKKNWLSRLIGLFSIFILRAVKKEMDPDLYNGASFLGLRGIVIKSHGGTSVRGFETAIKQAMIEVDHNVPELIHDRLHALLAKKAS